MHFLSISRTSRILPITLLVVLLLPTNSALISSAAPPEAGFAGCADGCWTLVVNATTPSLYRLALHVVFAVTFRSNFSTTTTGIVDSTFRNNTGAVVAHVLGNLTIPSNADATASLTIPGLKVGLGYGVTYFARDTSGKNISVTNDGYLNVAGSPPFRVQEPLSMITSSLCNVGCPGPFAGPDVMVTYKNTLDLPIQSLTFYGLIQSRIVDKSFTTAMVYGFDAGKSLTIPFYVGGLSAGDYTLSTVGVLSNGTALSGTSDMNFEVLQNGSLFVGQTMDWTLVKGPTFGFGGTNPFVQATYSNNLNFTVTGIVWLVIHNSAGQTIAYSTATLILPGRGNGTAYDVVFGLPPGTYYANLFVTSVSWVAISDATPLTFSLR